MEELNNLDKKILYELESNSRQSLSKISRTLRTSQQVISYRLKNLEKEKIIKKYIAIIDYTKIGYKNIIYGLKTKNISALEKKQILEWLLNQEKINYVCEAQGTFNFMFGYFYKREEEILEIIHNIKNNFYNEINFIKILPVLEMNFFNRDYFFKKYRNSKHEIIIENGISKQKIDELDVKILELISNNSKTPTTEIAKKNNTLPEIVVNKIKKLNQIKIILGYRMFLDLQEKTYYLLIKLKTGKNKEIINHLKNLKNIIFVLKTVGEYEIVAKYETDKKEDIYKETNNIKEKFHDVIDDVDIIFVNVEHKLNFFVK